MWSGKVPARHRRTRQFSLIEVLLALGVVAFGLVSIMALLPASIRAGRDAIGETHSAQAAENLIQLLSTQMRRATTPEAWDALVNPLPTEKPGVTEPTSGWAAWFSQEGIAIQRGGSNGEFFRLEMVRPEDSIPEFAGTCRAWRQPATITRYEEGTWSTVTLPTSEGIALHVEVSWPSQLPYPRRQKSLYALNVFRGG